MRSDEFRVLCAAAICRGKLNGFSSSAADSRRMTEVRSLEEQVFSFRSIRNKDFSREYGAATRLRRDKAAGTTKVNQPGGFHVNEQDTTAVLSPISGQAEETEKTPSLRRRKPRRAAKAATGRHGKKALRTAEREQAHQDFLRIGQPRACARRSASSSVCRWARPGCSGSADGEVHFQLLENVRGADVFRRAADVLPG